MDGGHGQAIGAEVQVRAKSGARRPQWITDRDPLYKFMHGSPWDYDTRIPVLFHGPPFIRPTLVNYAGAQVGHIAMAPGWPAP